MSALFIWLLSKTMQPDRYSWQRSIQLIPANFQEKSCAECDEFPCSTLKENLDNLNNLKQLAIKYKTAE